MAGQKIACILGEGFEDSEFRVPVERLQAAGYDVVVIGKQAGERLEGKQGKERTKADLAIDDAAVDDFELLFIPGGQSPDHLRVDERFVDFVRDFHEAGKPIAAVCHGPQLITSAGIQRDRKLTAWPTVQADLREAGADVVDEEVCEDRNWITSRKPDDLPAFSDAIVRKLESLREAPSARGDDPSAHAPA